MAEQAKIVTGIGNAELHRILVRGYDLNRELVGKITFTDMTSLMLRGRLPTPNEAKMLDALLVILVEHGMVSHVVAARLVYHCAPEAIQAAVAAALCGAGSVHLGSSEWSAKMLTEALPPDSKDSDLDHIANAIFEDYSARKQRMPGLAIALTPKATRGPRLSSGSPKIIKSMENIASCCRSYRQLPASEERGSFLLMSPALSQR